MLSNDTILNAFLAYIEDDAEAVEVSYIVDKLRDTCGLRDDEIEEIGLGWLLEACEEE